MNILYQVIFKVISTLVTFFSIIAIYYLYDISSTPNIVFYASLGSCAMLISDMWDIEISNRKINILVKIIYLVTLFMLIPILIYLFNMPSKKSFLSLFTTQSMILYLLFASVPMLIKSMFSKFIKKK